MTNLAATLVDTATRVPDKVGIKLDQAEVSWSALHRAAARVAGQLKAAGLQTGDRVSLILPNVPAYPVVFYGALLAGGIVVPMNPLLKSGRWVPPRVSCPTGTTVANLLFRSPSPSSGPTTTPR